MSGNHRQNLLLDADDTLWENHAYFLAVLTEFLDLMEGRGHRREIVLATLRAVEAQRTLRNGFGSLPYAESLIATVERLEGLAEPELVEKLQALGRWIYHHPIELFAGVPQTLELLAARHHLVLVTKGDRMEQLGKVRRSGIARYFADVEILSEKSAEEYVKLCGRHGFGCDQTWMVGNSPRSDINPARRAGLKTVYIPHHSIWEFEVEDLHGLPDLELKAFRELTRHF